MKTQVFKYLKMQGDTFYGIDGTLCMRCAAQIHIERLKPKLATTKITHTCSSSTSQQSPSSLLRLVSCPPPLPTILSYLVVALEATANLVVTKAVADKIVLWK